MAVLKSCYVDSARAIEATLDCSDLLGTRGCPSWKLGKAENKGRRSKAEYEAHDDFPLIDVSACEPTNRAGGAVMAH